MKAQAVDLMSVPRFQPVVLGLLYHISMEDKYKSLFTYTECIPRLYEMLTRVQVGVGAGVGSWWYLGQGGMVGCME